MASGASGQSSPSQHWQLNEKEKYPEKVILESIFSPITNQSIPAAASSCRDESPARGGHDGAPPHPHTVKLGAAAG
jgi:hypothetical protein